MVKSDCVIYDETEDLRRGVRAACLLTISRHSLPTPFLIPEFQISSLVTGKGYTDT